MVVLQQSKLWHCGILFYYHKVHITSTMNSRVCQAKGAYFLQCVVPRYVHDSSIFNGNNYWNVGGRFQA
jgi:hypothetical protein